MRPTTAFVRYVRLWPHVVAELQPPEPLRVIPTYPTGNPAFTCEVSLEVIILFYLMTLDTGLRKMVERK